MRQFGLKYTCDRCGTEFFVDFAKIDADTQQYYESSRESHPREWSFVHGCYLCPDCGHIYRENFWKFIEKENHGDHGTELG